MIGGYFLGLYLGFGLIIIGIEFYYFILSRYIEKDLTVIEAIIFMFCLIISIVIFIKFLSLENLLLGFVSFLPLPVAAVIIKTIKSSKEKIQQKIDEEKELKNWLYTIENQPENVNAYVAAGDIYFKRNQFEKALEFYQKAEKLINMPYIMKKIKITEKEIKIKNGIVWVCPECSFDNPENTSRCRVCGYSRMDKDLIKDVKHHKRELLKALLFIILAPIGIILFFVLYIIMPMYLALVLTILFIYLTIKIFSTY